MTDRQPRQIEFRRTTLDGGKWRAIRIVLPAADFHSYAPDNVLYGADARRAMLQFILATASGIGRAFNAPFLSMACRDVWHAINDDGGYYGPLDS
jgi:hypothetical protein